MKKKNNNLVTKIALIVAIIALLFSIVTLVRSIIIHAGIVLAIVQVIGTAIIVAVCSIMLYVLNTTEDDDEDDEEEEQDEEESKAEELPLGDINIELKDIEMPENGDYDLSNFE